MFLLTVKRVILGPCRRPSSLTAVRLGYHLKVTPTRRFAVRWVQSTCLLTHSPLSKRTPSSALDLHISRTLYTIQEAHFQRDTKRYIPASSLLLVLNLVLVIAASVWWSIKQCARDGILSEKLSRSAVFEFAIEGPLCVFCAGASCRHERG